MIAFLRFVENSTAEEAHLSEDPRIQEMYRKINTLKNSETVEADYMTAEEYKRRLQEEAEEKGKIRGEIQTQLDMLQVVMRKFGKTADEAMDMLGPDPKAVARQSAADARRAAEEQYAKDTLAATGLGGGIVSSQMLLDQMNGDDAELTAQRAAADREWTYGHIVVDEAQELTAMDWRMLIRRCPSRSFTIVGDVAQTSALGGTRRWSKSMNRLFGESHWDLNELTINYRNPQEVSELASRFAEEEGLYISTVNAVRTIPDSVSRNVVPDMSSLLETTAEQAAQLAEQFVSADGTGRIAVICPDNLIAPVRDAVRRKLAVILDPAEYARLIEQPEWDEQISVCGTETVKGLEFDAVVVVEPGLIEDDAPSRLVAASDLYVAMTRPTQKLVIVRTKADEKSLNI